nr:2-succinyl-6-hydroxy-2,4-cyclohexadiene-1-carboxylate synthase [Bacillus benzoevorans]
MHCEINGLNYYIEERGSGFPLILLHGFTGDCSTWEPFYQEWSGHSRLIAIDIIGHGKSDSPEQIERYDMLSVTNDIKKILEQQLHIEKADLLGYSMGGRLALSFAILFPQMVRKLILESSSPGLESETERENRRKQDEKLGLFILEQGMEKFVDYWENISLFATQKKLPSPKQERVRKQRLKNSDIGLHNSLTGMGTGAQPSWWQQLHKIEAETLLVTGSLDEKFCLIAKKMMKKIKQCKWLEVDGSGHAIHVENPDKFGTIMKRFLSNSN